MTTNLDKKITEDVKNAVTSGELNVKFYLEGFTVEDRTAE